MKGLQTNNKVKIECLVCNSIGEYSFHIKIYDSKQNIVYDSYTSFKGVLEFEVPYNDTYIVVAIANKGLFPEVACKRIYLIKSLSYNIKFLFYKCCEKLKHQVTFKLTDKNYENLPIMKGEIILWLDHM